MSKNKGFSRVMALVLLICMVVSFAPAAYADVDEAPAVQEETVVEESTVKKPVSEEEAPVEENDAETPEQPAVPSGSNSIKNCLSSIALLMTPMPIRPTTGSAAM